MFRQALVVGIFLIVGLATFLSFALFRTTDGDQINYHALLEKVAPKTDRNFSITQHRKGVVKEFQMGTHHLILNCSASSLHLSSAKTFEEMEQLKGSLNGLYTFEAEKGSYDYRNHIFTAEKGTFQGEAFSGKGERCEIYLGKSPEDAPLKGEKLIALKGASHFQSPKGALTSDLIWIACKGKLVSQVMAIGKTTLTLSDKKALTSLGTLTLDQEHHLITTGNGRVHYTQPNGWFASDEMTLTYRDSQTLKELHLEGNVHLKITQEKLPASLALADKAHYILAEDLLTLTASKNRFVLFLDESSNTRLAAKEVIAHTKERSAKGVGGVRCFFHDDEFNTLKGVIR